jgi:DNA-binding NarL/FixJ family response regulator
MSPDHFIKVAIIEDDKKILDGLALLIGGTRGFVCTGAYPSVERALQSIEASLPDVVLIDLGLPGISGVQGIQILKRCYPKITTLVLTVYEDQERIFDALCAGACGYLVKGTSPARLLESLSEAMAGGAPMSPHIARRVIEHFRVQDPSKGNGYDLTPHELRLLRFLVDGHHYQSAADQLGVSVNTIRFHLRHIYEKLQVHSKSEAVAKALRERLVR